MEHDKLFKESLLWMGSALALNCAMRLFKGLWLNILIPVMDKWLPIPHTVVAGASFDGHFFTILEVSSFFVEIVLLATGVAGLVTLAWSSFMGRLGRN